MEVRKKIAEKRSLSACATEASADNSTNQEHHQDDTAHEFDSDDDIIVETPVQYHEDNALTRERENFTLWIKQPVNWTRFIIDNSSNTNNEDLNK